ncbi:Tn3 family transposase [Parendozoicomonas sp. Alg238-R29]|uniref:Tn3 family transposase n=1 Tax=Parendozoicomonas sp. Alg238-R29 TaxID=2993446 RepID=UPI00248F0218|nr:Tn3 family transposase [Parendozoicomonas sp. Alg238-R29]
MSVLRLIANTIIYDNSALLSGLVEKLEKQGNKKVVDILASLSPVAWSHIQLAGNCIFASREEILNLQSMLEGVDPLFESALDDELAA